MRFGANDIPQVSGWRASVKRLRRGSRRWLNQVLVRFAGTPEPKRRLIAGDINRILVVRVNKRLGNILFLTPMLRALHQGFPQATIDVLIRDAKQIPLLGNQPGIGTVYSQPASAAQFLALARQLRGNRYDLAVDPTKNSSANRVAMVLTGARQRLGFAGPDQWLRLTHATARGGSSHQAVQSIDLLTGGIEGIDFDTRSDLTVAPDEAAQQRALQYWNNALGGETSGPVIGFFTNATGRKRLDNEWWHRWLTAIEQSTSQARLLQILPPGIADQTLAPDIPAVCIRELDVLAAMLSHLAVFVAADSGPMHLGAAAGTPVIGLFKATSAAAYAPMGPNCVALEGDALTPDNAAVETLARIP